MTGSYDERRTELQTLVATAVARAPDLRLVGSFGDGSFHLTRRTSVSLSDVDVRVDTPSRARIDLAMRDLRTAMGPTPVCRISVRPADEIAALSAETRLTLALAELVAEVRSEVPFSPGLWRAYASLKMAIRCFGIDPVNFPLEAPLHRRYRKLKREMDISDLPIPIPVGWNDKSPDVTLWRAVVAGCDVSDLVPGVAERLASSPDATREVRDHAMASLENGKEWGLGRPLAP